MTNFGYLDSISGYELFAAAAIEAEKVYATSPAMCAVGCRKALELAVKWVYSADNTVDMPYKDNLHSLIHEPSFRFALDEKTWDKLSYIIKLGNLSVHTERAVNKADALLSLESLFEFIEWIDYCYGADYVERHFDPALIPTEKVIIDTKKIKEQESLIEQKDSEIAALQAKLAEMSETLTAAKAENRESRAFTSVDISEFETRKRYIDLDLRSMGWKFDGTDADVWEEYEVDGMNGVFGQKGYCDYVLFGRDGLPLAVIEAKRSSKDPNIGRQQAVLYADCLERRFGRRPMMFTSNGFETYFWDDLSSPQRRVSGFFTRSDLEKLMDRRHTRKKLATVPIDDDITDRYYQKEAIRAVCEHIEQGFRKALLVMATGTGKTRTASSLTDVLSRGGHITNILFLADRTALVKQAKDDFKNYLPDMSLCNLCSNKEDKNARIVFSTYPTLLNSIDTAKTEDGVPLFSPAHFDLIITDESHRSIFKKYRAIFEYFDAIVVGLTATPKTDVDRNTYEFFEMENGVPTYAYDYGSAIKDHYLVPFYNYEVKTRFLEEGITYDDLSDEDKARYEDDFTEDGYTPDFIPSAELNKFVFNETTVDTVLQDLMERGIKTEGGDRLGKTIIFAQNKLHAEFIVQRFNKLYPQYKGKFAQRITCEDAYAQTIIDDFKFKAMPVIAVSVDMMDTGIDVPSCVDLVFFKKVRSKTKFWQMIGRGTRLCKDLACVDGIFGEYTDKRHFLIFDYCGNFEFFRENKNGYETAETKTLTEMIYFRQVKLIYALQEGDFADDDHQQFRSELVKICHTGVCDLSYDLVSVRLKTEYVERYRKEEIWVCLSDMDKRDLEKHIAPLISTTDTDEYAKRFDNFMYGFMLDNIDKLPKLRYDMKQLIGTAALLEKKAAIPQVKQKLQLIQDIQTETFWDDMSILTLEKIRRELRDLMQFLIDDGPGKPPIFTKLDDPVISSTNGKDIDPAYDFEDYRKKVNRYVEEHKDDAVISKLYHNQQLTKDDLSELERILTKELGDSEDYKREYGDTPFGLLIRKIAKLDHESALAAFSQFINDSSLNQRQIEFVMKIITHIENNGYIEDIKILLLPPFDKPFSFMKMFDAKTRTALIQTIDTIKQNAVVTV